jgi:Skp1 family, tetramerisation domain/Skp1 family, dimerisation domain
MSVSSEESTGRSSTSTSNPVDEIKIDFDEVLTVVSSDGISFEATRMQLQLSQFIEVMKTQDTNEKKFEVNVEAKTLERIIEYLKHHNGVPCKKILKPIRSQDIKKLADEWDTDFIKSFTQDEYIALLNSVNYLNISDLLNLACANWATFTKGKSAEEIRKMFAEKKMGKTEEKS